MEDPSPVEAVLTVVSTAAPHDVIEFVRPNQRLFFGRDTECDLVLRADPDHPRLSARAGMIWRMSDELWLRNISSSHDLYIEVPGRPPEPPLPPRRDDADRGAARSIPADLAFIRGPDNCELKVRQLRAKNSLTAGSEYSSSQGATVRLPALPAELRATALALCEPLLRGGQLPASYAQIGHRTGNSSRKAVRNQVERLTALYLDEVPALRDLVRARLQREADQLGLAATPRVVRGIVHFDLASVDLVDAAEQERRSALALPTYYEVAHLLVRRGVFTLGDLDSWDGGPLTGGH